ncbi:5746_t:CDS:10, partial [Entrophospora sp. SA101]
MSKRDHNPNNYRNFDRNSRGSRGSRGNNRGGRHNYQQRFSAPISPRDVENRQIETLNQNFGSSELSYRGSEPIVFIKSSYELDGLWKNYIKKKFNDQHQIRRFISSCLLTANKKAGHDVEKLISELGNNDGLLQRIREILEYEVSVDAGVQANVASFQRVILPFIALLIRSAIIDSVLETNVHAVYYLIYNNLDSFLLQKVIPMLDIIVQRNSIADNHTSQNKLLEDDAISFIPISIGQFFLTLVRFINELLTRVKEASINESMYKVIERLENLKTSWKNSFNDRVTNEQNDPLNSNEEGREYFFEILDQEFNNIKKHLKIQGGKTSNLQKTSSESKSSSQLYKGCGEFAALKRDYDPPGTLSKLGPRHDNDFEEFTKILIVPTKEEILCKRKPFIPTFNIPRSLELYWIQDNATRLLDAQFRLLREDMLCPIKNGITHFLNFMSDKKAENQTKIKQYHNDGGKFKHNDGGLHVYSNIMFENIPVDKHRGFILKVSFKQPHMKSKNKEGRKLYWKKSNKLMNGSLICLLLPANEQASFQKINDQYSFFFGIVASRDETDLCKERAEIGIEFMDNSVYPVAIRQLFSKHDKRNNFTSSNFMVESAGVYFESYYHVLKTIQSTNPSTLPFIQYLAPTINDDKSIGVQAPVYARAPNFYFDLSTLLKDKSKRLSLNVNDVNSYQNVIKELQLNSQLDDTQAKALVLSLCHEIALIQGPPGTGKTFVGVELMKVLLSRENHTKGKFGSRSKSDRIRQYNIEELYHMSKFRPLSSYELKERLGKIKIKVEDLQMKLTYKQLMWHNISRYLRQNFPKVVGKKKSKNKDNKDKSIFGQWLAGRDIDNAKSWEDYDDYENDYETFIDPELKEFISCWKEPKGDRPIEELIKEANVWKMSIIERIKLHDFWLDRLHDHWIDLLYRYKRSYEGFAKQVDEIYNQNRRRILVNCQVIGMTTNGAAKFQSLIRSISPRIIICEEAGEVLEAHILSSLSPYTQHLILIGDHQQLRPHCATYDLSVESATGKPYGLDISLFERLVEGGNAMKLEKCQLTTQRRMRAMEISDLIRNTLYPGLIDSAHTFNYDKVRGTPHNVYFIDHRYQEDRNVSEHALQSHSNQYEVNMVVEMVKYFIKNGYKKPGAIAVLTPYLGQLMKLRDALSESITVVIDERDRQNIEDFTEDGEDGKDDSDSQKLDDNGNNSNDFGENNVEIIKTNLNQQVILRTVDNFQGEEADIVIISLVRNSSDLKDHNQKETIGFLNIYNRTNVLLSRARHGMYLFGNSELMSRKSPKMWRPVIDMLKQRNPPQVGFGFPIACDNHSEHVNIITEAYQFENVSPDGGCHLPCTHKLPCGHACPLKCHSDNSRHSIMFCEKKCSRLYPGCGHPCDKICGDDCGKCMFPIDDLILPCGHIYENPRCHEVSDLSNIKCRKIVKHVLPNCGHEHPMMCCLPVDSYKCKELCKGNLPCGHVCKSFCSHCVGKSINDQAELDSNGFVVKTKHESCRELCNKMLKCGHVCREICHIGKECGNCRQLCGLGCSHIRCREYCNQPCKICWGKCDWYCEHQGNCESLCSLPCSRLPCDMKCRKKLECGHDCNGVCGEVCPSKKYCIMCASNDVKKQVVVDDKKFEEIDWNVNNMIVLECGHVFTMNMMDEIMKIQKYYNKYLDQWKSTNSFITEPEHLEPCPNCQYPIKNVRRYGRIIKKSIINLQRKNYLPKWIHQFKSISENFNGLYNNLKSNEKGFLRTLQNVIRNHDNQYYTKKTKGTNSFIVQAFELRNLKNLYDIPIKYQKLWRKHINSYLNNYENLYKFISERRFSPHINAFFHSLNEICKSKYGMTLMDKFGKFSVDEHGSNASRNREDLQLIVQMIGGNSILKTDKSFYVDTLFTLFDVQKTMLNEINRTNDYTLQLEKDEIIKNLSEINKKCTTIKDSKPVSFVTRKAEKVCKDNETYEKLINQEVFEEIGDLNTILKRLFKEAFTSILAIERGSKIKFAGMIDDDNDEDEDFDKELLNNEPIVIPDEDLEDI